ncbi:amidase [Acidisoma silvae]|uniref:Amidase n=1 Tax=Acidisoma silvae TaxID=2802396 RepID=A0A963YPP7_9PROT|nr:amidase [Acidisoma silvae]MCB8873980.1 amidase [Acidisoma silvae]
MTPPWTVRTLGAALARGDVTAEAVAELSLARIAAEDGTLNAIITPNPHVLEDARAIDRRRAAGEAVGPLAGIPVLVKDTMDMAGLPTTGGWSKLSARAGGVDLIPRRDSAVVARMRAAGALLLGKTNVPVMSASGTNANDSWAGPTLNAIAPERAPGGSSAGSATGVAAGYAVIGLAEETGGSIQNPAAAQGLVGIKPTFGLVPNSGVMPLANSTRDVVGPVAQTVRGAAIALDVLAGYTPEDPKTVAGIGRRPLGGYAAAIRPGALQGKRLGLYGPGWRHANLSPASEALFRTACEGLRALGAELIEDPFAGSGFADLAHFVSALPYDPRGEESVVYDLDRYLATFGPDSPINSLDSLRRVTGADPFDPAGPLGYLWELEDFRHLVANYRDPPPLTRFLGIREHYLQIFKQVMNAHRLDAMVMPQTQAEPPLLHAPEPILETAVSEINIAGLPAITVPAGLYPSGAGFGLLFVGRLWKEARLIAFAAEYEAIT